MPFKFNLHHYRARSRHRPRRLDRGEWVDGWMGGWVGRCGMGWICWDLAVGVGVSEPRRVTFFNCRVRLFSPVHLVRWSIYWFIHWSMRPRALASCDELNFRTSTVFIQSIFDPGGSWGFSAEPEYLGGFQHQTSPGVNLLGKRNS